MITDADRRAIERRGRRIDYSSKQTAAYLLLAAVTCFGCSRQPEGSEGPPEALDRSFEDQKTPILCPQAELPRPCGVLRSVLGPGDRPDIFIGLEYGVNGELVRESFGNEVVEHFYGEDGCRHRTVASGINGTRSSKLLSGLPPLPSMPVVQDHLLLDGPLGLDWFGLATDSLDRTWSVDFERDKQGRLSSAVSGGIAYLKYEYAAEGDLRSVVSRSGATWTLEYDNGRLSAVEREGDYTLALAYDQQGRLSQVQGGEEEVSIFDYGEDFVRYIRYEAEVVKRMVEWRTEDGRLVSVCVDGGVWDGDPYAADEECDVALKLLYDCTGFKQAKRKSESVVFGSH